jgi:hypothetical protein
VTVEKPAGVFQVCGSCKRAWPAWHDFVLDPAVRLVGLQAVVVDPDFNVLIFEHRCGSSISILTPRLRHLLPEAELDGPPTRLMGSEQCRGHCRFLEDLEACDAPCSNARDRKLILLVQSMKRSVEATAGTDLPISG